MIAIPQMHPIAVALGLLLGLVLALLAWGCSLLGRPGNAARQTGRQDVLLLGLLVVAALGLGTFLALSFLPLK